MLNQQAQQLEIMLKQKLAQELCGIIEGHTQFEAAVLLHVPQPQISRLRRSKLWGFSASRLMRLIAGRGHSIAVHFPHRPLNEPASVTVVRYDRFGLPISS